MSMSLKPQKCAIKIGYVLCEKLFNKNNDIMNILKTNEIINMYVIIHNCGQLNFYDETIQ